MIDLLPLRRELAAEALDGLAHQAGAAARFLGRGDDRAAAEAYARIVSIFREFVAPEMRTIVASMDDRITGEAAAEWREENAKRRPQMARSL